MGKFDSSRTRVAPVFDHLFASDPSGAAWLDRLIALGSRVQSVPAVPTGQRLVDAHGPRWGRHEASLRAPRTLLAHLVRTITPDQVAADVDSSAETRLKREALARRDERAVAEGLQALEAGHDGKKWFVLEGESRPDALLETEDVVLCIEGKRTERSCTSTTKWMGERSQLVRHMDAAREAYAPKRVLGLLIVEGSDGEEGLTPSEFWRAECAAQFAPKMLADSLPHRSDIERQVIAKGILGVATWQGVCREFGIPWPPVQD